MTRTPDAASPVHVVVAGGGVAALEAVLALRALADYPDEEIGTFILERWPTYAPDVRDAATAAPARSISSSAVAGNPGWRASAARISSAE